MREAIVAGLVLGLVAAAVVWFLERYQTELLAEKFARFLREQERGGE